MSQPGQVAFTLQEHIGSRVAATCATRKKSPLFRKDQKEREFVESSLSVLEN